MMINNSMGSKLYIQTKKHHFNLALIPPKKSLKVPLQLVLTSLGGFNCTPSCSSFLTFERQALIRCSIAS